MNVLHERPHNLHFWFSRLARILAQEAKPVIEKLIKDLCTLCTNVPLVYASIES